MAAKSTPKKALNPKPQKLVNIADPVQNRNYELQTITPELYFVHPAKPVGGKAIADIIQSLF